jgi:hypothetical protein
LRAFLVRNYPEATSRFGEPSALAAASLLVALFSRFFAASHTINFGSHFVLHVCTERDTMQSLDVNGKASFRDINSVLFANEFGQVKIFCGL